MCKQTTDWISVQSRMPDAGKNVLACYKNRSGVSRRICAFWRAGKTVESGEDSEIGVYDEADDCYYDPEGWYESIDNWSDYTYCSVTEGVISHWMALPEPPYGNFALRVASIDHNEIDKR